MKRSTFAFLSTAVAVTAISSEALAKKSGYSSVAYGMAGCGVGSLLELPNNNMQLITSFVNTWFGATATSAITSGTSNCVGSSASAYRKEQEIYLSVNYEKVKADAAKGDGDYLFAFADVLGCTSHNAWSQFSNLTQTKFDHVFAGKTSDESLEIIKEELDSNDVLAEECSRI